MVSFLRFTTVINHDFPSYSRYYHQIAQHYSQVQEYKVFYEYFAVISQLVCLQDSILKDCFCFVLFSACGEILCQGRGPTGCY